MLAMMTPQVEVDLQLVLRAVIAAETEFEGEGEADKGVLKVFILPLFKVLRALCTSVRNHVTSRLCQNTHVWWHSCVVALMCGQSEVNAHLGPIAGSVRMVESSSPSCSRWSFSSSLTGE